MIRVGPDATSAARQRSSASGRSRTGTITAGRPEVTSVITADGTGSYSIWCQQMQCIGGTTYSHDAKQYCERDSGQDCVVFAVRDEIRVQYEIRK